MTTPQRPLAPKPKMTGSAKWFLVIFAAMNLLCFGLCASAQIKNKLDKPARDARRTARDLEPPCPMRDLSDEHLDAWDDACPNEKAHTCTSNGGGGFLAGPSCVDCVDNSIGMYRGDTLTIRKVVRACLD